MKDIELLLQIGSMRIWSEKMIIREILHPISLHFKLVRQNIKWRKKNYHNNIRLLSLCNISSISVGKCSYGDIDVHTFGNEEEKLLIGNYCSITNGCSFILSGEHDYKRFTTFPIDKMFCKENTVDAKCKGQIIIEDDVWIGFNCTILSGVRIGKGAVIGAGSVVSQDIPPYSIVVGSPAKVIKYRFSDIIIEKLKQIDFSNIDNNQNIEIEELIDHINEQNVEKVINLLK